MNDSAENKTHIILVNGLVEKDGKILISQRSWDEPHMPGYWTIPGGKVEKTKGNVWDILEKTLAAEVKEETGVTIGKNVELVSNNTFIRSTGQHVVALNFLCHWKSGTAKALEDTIAVKWVSSEELSNFKFPENVKEYIKAGFKRLKQ